jgi:hypothetical protein
MWEGTAKQRAIQYITTGAALIAAATGWELAFIICIALFAVFAFSAVWALRQSEKHGLTKAEAERLEAMMNELEDTLNKWRVARDHAVEAMAKSLRIDIAEIAVEMKKNKEIEGLTIVIDELLHRIDSPTLGLSILAYQEVVFVTDKQHLQCLLGEIPMPQYLETRRTEKRLLLSIRKHAHRVRVEHKPAGSRL